jgi:hypothetical protein
MKFKDVEGFYVYHTQSGKIAIRQNSFEFGKDVDVYLTLEQFKNLERWVTRNECEIDELWNGGVEYDSEA